MIGQAATATAAVTHPVAFRERRWVLVVLLLADVAALELSVFLAWATRLLLTRWMSVRIGLEHLQPVGLAALVLPLIQAVRGMYPGYGTGPVARLRDRSYAVLLFFGALAVWDYLVFKGCWSRGMLLIAVVYALVLVPLVEAVVREALVRLRMWGQPVVVLGAAQTATLVVRLLGQNRGLGLVPVALLDDDREKQGLVVERVPVVGPLEAAEQWAKRARVAIVAMPGAGRILLDRLVQDLSFPRVILVSDLFGLESLWVEARDLGGVLGLEIPKNLLAGKNRVLKRVVDYALGIPLFLVSIPLITFFALWIKRVSPGPAFFTQEREGVGGKVIILLKG